MHKGEPTTIVVTLERAADAAAIAPLVLASAERNGIELVPLPLDELHDA